MANYTSCNVQYVDTDALIEGPLSICGIKVSDVSYGVGAVFVRIRKGSASGDILYECFVDNPTFTPAEKYEEVEINVPAIGAYVEVSGSGIAANPAQCWLYLE